MEATSLERKVEALRGCDVFGSLPPETLERLAESMHDFEAPAGQVLIEPGQRGSGMFVITDGEVEVEARGGRRRCGSGEIVGELALLTSDGTRTARVRAATPVRCLTLDRTSFDRELRADPRLAVALLDVVASRLADAGAASG
jgi:CRP/FNR family transcriptional regulator, cyclic AMP receptor protein